MTTKLDPPARGSVSARSVDHGFGVTTVYAHLSEVSIPAEGMWVDETTQLGAVGSTGSSSTPHLHFERLDGEFGSEIYDRTSTDPGPLLACRGDLLVAFPEVAGHDTWEGLPWGAMTVASDGQACTTSPGEAFAAAVDEQAEMADLLAELRRS